MSDLRMDPVTNDLVIINGDLALVDGSDAIAQDLQQQLQLWLGEWFLDTSKGMPFRQYILIKNPNVDVIQAIVVQKVTSVNGITQMLDFSMNYDPTNRAVSMSIVAEDSTGAVIKVQASVGLPLNGTIEGTPT